MSGMADKRLKIFDSLDTSKALFVSTVPRLKDGGHERYEVFRRTAANRVRCSSGAVGPTHKALRNPEGFRKGGHFPSP
jgi:hypothetical protein